MAGKQEDHVESDELSALARAIKFAHPNHGYKQVHQEILGHGGKYASVTFKSVKKLMQKLNLNEADHNSQDDQLRFMTIGGNSKSEREDIIGQKVPVTIPSDEKDCNSWCPVKLDVPMMAMNEHQFQATISMTFSEEGESAGALGEIYKAQLAQDTGDSNAQLPILIYNKPRNRKTFVHHTSVAYAPITKLIQAFGVRGVGGGTKAYFWGRYVSDDDLLYINTEKVAPSQQW